jgi:hypothetical protein
MAAAPQWKIYNDDGEYIAACKYIEDAAVIVANQPDGSTIRDGHRTVVWTEGRDGRAWESYDWVAEVALKRRVEGRT